MSASAPDLFCLKGLLRSFSDSTGLKMNFSKSFIVPINVSDEKCQLLANTLGCQVGTMPFTYLGLPLGTTRPSVEEFMPLLNIIEKRMMGINKFLSYPGRLILVNSVYAVMPTFHMCAFKLPVPVLDQVEKYCKSCLWKGGDLTKKGGCLVAWTVACRPTEQGGLGIIDVRSHNTALLLKYLYKFYSKADLPWVTLTWSHFYKRGNPPHVRS